MSALTDKEVYAVGRYGPATIYILEADHGVKIGMSIWADAGPRKRDIERTVGHHVRLVATWRVSSSEKARSIERRAHTILADDRLLGEWFCTHPILAVDLIDELIRRSIPAEAPR